MQYDMLFFTYLFRLHAIDGKIASFSSCRLVSSHYPFSTLLGVSFHTCEDFLTLLCQSDQWSSPRFCGAKGVGFATLLPYPLVLSVKDMDFDSLLMSYELVVRKLVTDIKAEARVDGEDGEAKVKVTHVVVVVSGGSGENSEDAARQNVLQLFKQVQEDLDIDVSTRTHI